MKLKVMNRETGRWEEREPFDKAFLEFAVVTTSQYDGTCRRMAAQILASEAECARLTKRADELAADCLQVSREAFSLSQALSESQAEVAKLRREAEDVRKLDAWLKANPDRSLNSTAGWSEALSKGFAHLDQGDARVQIRASHDAVESFWSDSLQSSRRAAVEYLEKERKDG